MINSNYLLMCAASEIQKQFRFRFLTTDEALLLANNFVLVPTLDRLSRFLRSCYSDLYSLIASLYNLAEDIRNPYEEFPFDSLEELLLALLIERFMMRKWDIKEKKWKPLEDKNVSDAS